MASSVVAATEAAVAAIDPPAATTAGGPSWLRLHRGRFAAPAACLFLDRDGVVCVERGYIADPAAVALETGAVALMTAARAQGYALVCITNQGGIGKGVVSWRDYQAVQDRISGLLAVRGLAFDAVALCPTHPDGVGALRGDHDWRKPRPGMLRAAAEGLNLDLIRSAIVGDSVRDLEAGRAAGLLQGALTLTGHGPRDSAAAAALATPDFAVRIVAHPGEAATLLTAADGAGLSD